MSPKMLFVAAALGAALVLPDVSAAQAPSGQDSVTFTGGPALAGSLTVTSINATSGPSGENPSGEVNGAPVTCLAVRGNTATINTRIPLPRPPPFDFGIVTVQVIDDQPDTFDVPEVGRAPTDCSPAGPGVVGGPLSAGDITVVRPATPHLEGPVQERRVENVRLQSPGAMHRLQSIGAKAPALARVPCPCPPRQVRLSVDATPRGPPRVHLNHARGWALMGLSTAVSTRVAVPAAIPASRRRRELRPCWRSQA
jgi:hypothetical protein